MGKLRIPYVEIKEVEIDFNKVADIIYQYCKEDGYIDEYIENEETPEDAAEDMYLNDNIYSAIIGPLTERVKNDLIKK